MYQIFYTIYKTTNTLNGKIYIGKHQTNDLDDGYLGSGKFLKRAIKKHGVENFSKEILHVFENETDMNAKEKELVELGPHSYNLCEGGKGGFGYINDNGYNGSLIAVEKRKMQSKEWNDEFERKRLEGFRLYCSMNDITPSEKCREASVKVWKGQHHSTETKKKLSLSHQGKHQGSKNSQFGTCWITKDSVNRKCKKEELETFLEQGWSKGRI